MTRKIKKAQSHKQGISPKLKNLYRHALSDFRSRIGCFMSLMPPRATHFFQKPFPSHDLWVTPLAALLFCMMNFGSSQSAHAEEIRESEQIIGDLGGMPISISSSIVNESDVKYSDFWMVGHKKPIPKRTYQSKLEALSFHMRFEDKTLLTNAEAESLKLSAHITETPLLEVAILAGNANQIGDLAHLLYVFNEHFKNKELWFASKKLKEKKYGLNAYQLSAELLSTGVPVSGYKTTKTGYFDLDKNNKIETSIFCANPQNETTKCLQGWSMENQGVQVFARVEYRTGLMEHWRVIREVVSQAILKFRVDPGMLEKSPNDSSYSSSNLNAE